VINVDDGISRFPQNVLKSSNIIIDESSSKKPRRNGPTGTKSPHFPTQDLLPQSTHKPSRLDEEAHRRGIHSEDHFSKAYTASPTLADDIVRDMKSARQPIQVPGQGNKRRELVQDKPRETVPEKRREMVLDHISRGESRTVERRSSAPFEFQLSWIMRGSEKEEEILTKMCSEKLDFFNLPGGLIETIHIRDVTSVKVLSETSDEY
jgi:hypothetical protein